jgi:hypothetical protein
VKGCHPTIRGALLEGVLDGSAQAPPKEVEEKVSDKTIKKPNPDHVRFIAMDQQLLSYIFSSLSRDIFIGVGRHQTSAQVWRALCNSFASQTQARSVNTRISLATTKKGEMSVTDYFNKTKFPRCLLGLIQSLRRSSMPCC